MDDGLLQEKKKQQMCEGKFVLYQTDDQDNHAEHCVSYIIIGRKEATQEK